MLRTHDYLVEEKMPTFWCSGCGNGSILAAIFRSFEELGLEKKNTVVVTGIGCWGKADDYSKTNTFHGTHGRALPYATGIKLANPELNVIVLMGDGDGTTIGGNHLIHAARRNVDVTAIIVNNLNYGMTGGQYSGTTPHEAFTSTSTYGHVEDGFDVCGMIAAAGAPYVARGSVHGIPQVQKFVTEGIKNKGFSLVEVISTCPTHFGKRNRFKSPADMIKDIKDNSVSVKQAEKLSDEEKRSKFVIGKFADRKSDDYTTRYNKVIEKAMAIKGGK